MDDYTFSTDPARLQLDVVHPLLASSYWASGIRRDIFEKSFQNSLCVSAFSSEGVQVGVARLITDHATFAYLCDVIVAEPHRGRGIGKKMVAILLDTFAEPHIRNIALFTKDMQPLYRQFGFIETEAGRCMQLKRPPENWT